jgi:hypothetical protein
LAGVKELVGLLLAYATHQYLTTGKLEMGQDLEIFYSVLKGVLDHGHVQDAMKENNEALLTASGYQVFELHFHRNIVTIRK